MVAAALPSKMPHGLQQVRVQLVRGLHYVMVLVWIFPFNTHVQISMKVLLPLYDDHARHWLLLRADLQERSFFVYDSCPASRASDKEERKLLVHRAVKFVLSCTSSSHAPCKLIIC